MWPEIVMDEIIWSLEFVLKLSSVYVWEGLIDETRWQIDNWWSQVIRYMTFLHTVFSTFVYIEILHHRINSHNEIIHHLKIPWNRGSLVFPILIPHDLAKICASGNILCAQGIESPSFLFYWTLWTQGFSWISRWFCDIPLNYFHTYFRERTAKPKSRTWTRIGL